jgi:hypothetical protein
MRRARTGRSEATVLIDYAAPRFLTPAYALLAIPVADGLAWLLTGVRTGLRRVTRAFVVVGLALQLMSHHGALQHEVAVTVRHHSSYGRAAADLRRLGVNPPCQIQGVLQHSIAFSIGCAEPPSWVGAGPAVHVAVIAHAGISPPGYALGWHRYRLSSTRLVAYARDTQH